MMRVAGLLVVLVALAGCGFTVSQFGGQEWSETDGVVTVDGVKLPYKRWVPLELPVGGGSLELACATGDTVLGGSTDGLSHLEVLLYSELENDGSARVDGGKVVLTSEAGRLVAMNGARGTLAPGVRLRLQSGTGDQSLQDLPELGDLQVENGTGELRLLRCGAGELVLKSGTGDVVLEGVRAGRFELENGTGDTRLSACTLSSLEVQSGTGDVTLDGCSSPRTQVESGTGDVLLKGENKLGTPEWKLGTGDVKQL